MAKMIGVFSQIKGKIGNMIYATWHGVQVIKTMFIPANPQSVDQTAHRDIFDFLIQLGELIFDDIIAVIWNPFRRKASSGWSNWLKANLLLQTGATIDYSILFYLKVLFLHQLLHPQFTPLVPAPVLLHFLLQL